MAIAMPPLQESSISTTDHKHLTPQGINYNQLFVRVAMKFFAWESWKLQTFA